jgi:regulator of nucleoside diphosphate kinase
VKNRAIIVSDIDMDKLSHLVRASKQSLFRDQGQIDLLDQTLQSAEVVAPECIPGDVIRMNSRFRVRDLGTGKSERYTLVFPQNADISQGRMSILAPVGTALLGHATGDTVEAEAPGGTRRLLVEKVLSSRRRTTKPIHSVRRDVAPVNLGRGTHKTKLAA